MKIGIVSAEGRGETDRLISETASSLVDQGATLSGIVKVLDEVQPEGSHHCDMSVRVLPDEQTITEIPFYKKSIFFLVPKLLPLDRENLTIFLLIEISTKKKLLNYLGRDVHQNSTKEN